MEVKDIDVDIFIPTSKKLKNLETLLCQIYIALNSGINTRVTIGMKGEYPELMQRLTPNQLPRIRFIKDAPEGGEVGHLAIQYMLEELTWADWVRYICDDDCITPWGLKHMWEARHGVSMVVGQALGVSREKHYDFTAWKLGPSITFCHVAGNQVMFNMRSLEKLPKPWWGPSRTYDFDFIKRMSENFPYRIIPSVVDVMSFAELENLGREFQQNFHALYGGIL